MSVKLIVDNREGSVIDQLKQLGVSHELMNMDLGDFEIQGTQGQRFIFERKTWKDLAASLADGRFKNQKDRLCGVLQREPRASVV